MTINDATYGDAMDGPTERQSTILFMVNAMDGGTDRVTSDGSTYRDGHAWTRMKKKVRRAWKEKKYAISISSEFRSLRDKENDNRKLITKISTKVKVMN